MSDSFIYDYSFFKLFFYYVFGHPDGIRSTGNKTVFCSSSSTPTSVQQAWISKRTPTGQHFLKRTFPVEPTPNPVLLRTTILDFRNGSIK